MSGMRFSTYNLVLSNMQVLKDVGELLNLTLIQAQSRQPLSGSTTFHRIETTTSPDPLDGRLL